MHLMALSTMPKTKDWQEVLASHLARQASALFTPEGCERTAWLVLPLGAVPQTSRVEREKIGEPETAVSMAEAAMIVVKDCILKETLNNMMK